jgi:cystathionine beta-synthase
MQAAFPVVKPTVAIDDLCKLINRETPAVLVDLGEGKYHIVTRYDVISAMS